MKWSMTPTTHWFNPVFCPSFVPWTWPSKVFHPLSLLYSTSHLHLFFFWR
jgi:hypothetical protein